MMTKRGYKKVLMAVAVVVIGMGMVSCVDNIDNSTTPSDNQQADAQQARAEKYWAIVSQLVDVDDYTDDYEGKTFEPVYGVEGSEVGTRYVYTNDAATAAARFADLVEQEGIDETTEKYTFDDPDVGTLIYTKGSGRFLATVDVDIKQIPSLKKIVYMPGAYANGSFQGSAYYRFGDVVKRPVVAYGENNAEEQVDEYWICVRPSFGPEGKGDSHWVCLNMLPKKNTWYYKASNNNEYWLPKGLGTNKEHMQNLAEMLYAIYNPSQWEKNIRDSTNKNLKMFYDFHRSNWNYHNQHFWQAVQDAWKEHNITSLALNMDNADARRNFLDYATVPNIRLLYKGYSWWTMTSWNCTLYEVRYTTGYEDRVNMHVEISREVPKNMEKIAKVDCRKLGQYNVANYSAFFGDNYPRWTIRHATGKELSSTGRYNQKQPIDGVEEVYRYYSHVFSTKDLGDNPEVTTENKE
jgi:hypothetical protein